MSARRGARFYPTDGEGYAIEPANGQDFQLEELYQQLACRSIEVVPLSAHYLVIDEAGKLPDPPRPINHAATAIAWLNGAIALDDYIAGPAILCERGQLR